MVAQVDSILALDVHRGEELLRLESVCEDDGICINNPPRLCAHAILQNLLGRVGVYQIDIVAVKAQQVVGIVDATLAPNFRLWHKKVQILLGCILADVVSGLG